MSDLLHYRNVFFRLRRLGSGGSGGGLCLAVVVASLSRNLLRLHAGLFLTTFLPVAGISEIFADNGLVNYLIVGTDAV